MSTEPILAARTWPTNGHLIAACHDLGYLKDSDHILDPTWGRGTWWKVWSPKKLTKHDIKIDGVDFRQLPYPDGHFDACAYDPPYVAKGGRKTSGIKSMDERYGQDNCPATPKLLQELINDGLTEMHRVVKPRGVVLVKCQCYVSSGKLWQGDYFTQQHALALAFEVITAFRHIADGGRPQSERNRTGPQKHPLNNYSTLFVLRKGRA